MAGMINCSRALVRIARPVNRIVAQSNLKRVAGFESLTRSRCLSTSFRSAVPLNTQSRFFSSYNSKANSDGDKEHSEKRKFKGRFDASKLLAISGGTLLGASLFSIAKSGDDIAEDDQPIDTSNPLHYDENAILAAITENPLESLFSEEELAGIPLQKRSLLYRVILGVLNTISSLFEIGFITLRAMELSVRFAPLLSLHIMRLIGIVPQTSLPSSTPESERGYDNDFWGSLPHVMLRHTLEGCGPCFIKLGQWAATRPDLFPEQLCFHLGRLHASCPTHDFEHTKQSIEESFGHPIEHFFEEFNEQPIASGAIAQIYKAKLRATGETVAVKVRHPGVVEDICRDLKLLDRFAWLLTNLFSLHSMSLEESVEQFSYTMRMQVDLRREALNLIKFGKNFKHLSAVSFPKAYVPLCTSPSILVESFEVAAPLSLYLPSNHEKASKSEFTGNFNSEKIRKKIASLGARMFLKMLIVDNFIHADLHPGNIFVREETTPDGRPSIRFVVLDVGLVCELSDRDRENFLALFSAVVSGDARGGAELMATKNRGDHSKQTPEQIEHFKDEMDKLLTGETSKPLSEIEVGSVLSEVLRLCRKYNVKIESNYATMVVGIVVVEGIARQLHADFNLLEEARPMLQKDRAFVANYIKAKLRANK